MNEILQDSRYNFSTHNNITPKSVNCLTTIQNMFYLGLSVVHARIFVQGTYKVWRTQQQSFRAKKYLGYLQNF